MARIEESNWQVSSAVASALHPSTSKEYVWPRYDNVMFAAEHFATSDGGESVLGNLLRLEQFQLPKRDYFETVQTEVTVKMRSVVTEWMMEVCNEERCSCEVFPLAVTYLDRFLSVEVVHKHQLQSLATACLLLASKVKLPRHFDGGRLVLYTDGGVTISDLLSWELLVLDRLNWDIASFTAFDFIDQFLHRLRFSNQTEELRGSLNFLVAHSAHDFRLATCPPSMTAAICLKVAVEQVYGEAHITYTGFAEMFGHAMDIVMDPKSPHAVAVYDLMLRHQVAFAKPHLVLRQLQLPSFSLAFTQLSKIPRSPADSENELVSSAASTPTDIMDVQIF